MLEGAGAYSDADIAPLHSSSNSTEYPMCRHLPPCPTADAPDRDAACVVASHPEQGWSLLCNGVVCFDDLGELPRRQLTARASPDRPLRPPWRCGLALLLVRR